MQVFAMQIMCMKFQALFSWKMATSWLLVVFKKQIWTGRLNIVPPSVKKTSIRVYSTSQGASWWMCVCVWVAGGVQETDLNRQTKHCSTKCEKDINKSL